MKHCKHLTLLVAALIVLALSGCGKKEAPGPDTAPFEAAVNDYCKDHHMDMIVSGFKELDVQDDKATARVAMREKSGLYALTVVWKISFEREADQWKVTEVIR